MNGIQKKIIRELRASGHGIQQIAEMLSISPNTVKSYCQRNGLTGQKTLVDVKTELEDACKQCGAALLQRAHSKKEYSAPPSAGCAGGVKIAASQMARPLWKCAAHIADTRFAARLRQSENSVVIPASAQPAQRRTQHDRRTV